MPANKTLRVVRFRIAPLLHAFAKAKGILFYVRETHRPGVYRYVLGKGDAQQATRDPFRAWEWVRNAAARKDEA